MENAPISGVLHGFFQQKPCKTPEMENAPSPCSIARGAIYSKRSRVRHGAQKADLRHKKRGAQAGPGTGRHGSVVPADPPQAAAQQAETQEADHGRGRRTGLETPRLRVT